MARSSYLPASAALQLLLLCLLAITQANGYSPIGRLFDVRLGLWGLGPSSGWRQLFRLPPAKRYRKMLQEQTVLLDRQLRQSQEELIQIKKRFHALQEKQLSLTAQSSVERRDREAVRKQEMQSLKAQVATLEQQIGRINTMKEEMEALLQVEQNKVVVLQEKLAVAETESAAAVGKLERELATLQQQLEKKTTQQLQELEAIWNQRMKDALTQAATVSLAAQQQAVHAAEERVRLQAATELQAERGKATAAVEREKVKMRKLVKALAVREKKLLAATEQRSTSQPQRLAAADAKTKQVNRKADTVRGPLK